MSTISIEVDIGEVFYEIDDKQLLAEAKRRKLDMPDEAQATVREVIDLINAGEAEEAILRLEREFWPKWKSVDESRYALHTATRPANDNKEAAPGAVA